MGRPKRSTEESVRQYKRDWQRADYAKNPDKYRRKSATHYQLTRALFLRQAGARCAICGYDKIPDILQFDHIVPVMRNSKNKQGGFIGEACKRSLRNPDVWDEFHLNIQVLCPNCHAEKTAEQLTKHAKGMKNDTAADLGEQATGGVL